MEIAQLLAPERILCEPEAVSKKRSLEILSETLVNNEPGLSAHHVFESLLGREKLGSTGLGHGVALPHGRSSDISQARLAVIKLARGIDYDAPDTEPVDLLFALIVPEESTEEHLQILAMLAEMLADEKFLMQLRQTSDCDALFRLLTHWKKASNAA
ncbi:MAG TPA: PTS sugar transporter subunit IIA [Chromatiales bacterium]|nr:PTS sugar transporter subunit IIA [Thiotrichales bacterium]HIP69595.1 PTS sugar transporter subunit IIA [Chromatiales bacterium]